MTAASDRFAFTIPTYRFVASQVIYHVCPVSPALASELFDPYSPAPILPSMVGVAHCPHAGEQASRLSVSSRACLRTRERYIAGILTKVAQAVLKS